VLARETIHFPWPVAPDEFYPRQPRFNAGGCKSRNGKSRRNHADEAPIRREEGQRGGREKKGGKNGK